MYLREGDSFLMTTDSPWWKNLRGGAPVTLRVKGEEHPALGGCHAPPRYPSDLSDAEWVILEPLLSSAEKRGRPSK